MKRSHIKNSLGAFFASATNIVVSFVAQKVFLNILNAEYLGLNGLFSNIISMLAIFELGIGSAITFSLYRPIVLGDKEKIKALMNFYKKAYRIIAFIVLAVGIGVVPVLPSLIKDISIDVNIYVIYLLFLADVVCSYLLTYRRSILYADQKNYQINIVHICYLVLMNCLQLSILAITRNYYIYLIIKVIMRVLENIAIHLIVKRQYDYLNDIESSVLAKEDEGLILKKVRALVFHKIGTFIVLGTDNIIISKFIGLVEVGLYANYLLVINAINSLIGQTIMALTPTIGHKLAIEDSRKSYDLFKRTRFLGFVFACLSATVFFSCIQQVISLWVGKEYLLDNLTTALLSYELYRKINRNSYLSFKEAAGIYYEDRFAPLIESATNIVASIILLQFFGIAGVFMGTIISGLALWCYSYPKFVYKNLFKRSYAAYAKETIGYASVFMLSAATSYLATSQLHLESIVAQLAINATVSVFITSVIISIALGWTSSFKYFSQVLIKKISRK